MSKNAGLCHHPTHLLTLFRLVSGAHLHWCRRCGATQTLDRPWELTEWGARAGAQADELLRRAVGVVSDVSRLQAEASAVLDAYAVAPAALPTSGEGFAPARMLSARAPKAKADAKADACGWLFTNGDRCVDAKGHGGSHWRGPGPRP